MRVPAREIVDVSSAIVGDGRGRGRPPAKRDARGGGVPKKNGGGGTAKRDAGAGAADPGSGGPSAACEKSKPAASSGSLGGWEGPPLGLKSSSTALAAPLGFVVGGGTKRERKGDEVTSPAAEKTRRRRAKGALENRRARATSPLGKPTAPSSRRRARRRATKSWRPTSAFPRSCRGARRRIEGRTRRARRGRARGRRRRAARRGSEYPPAGGGPPPTIPPRLLARGFRARGGR